MKQTTYIIMISLTWLFCSCGDFLQEEDKDQVIPRTTDQYLAMMHQEAFLDVTWNYASDLMTDDIQDNERTATTAKNTYKSLYTWQRNVEIDGKGNRTNVTNQWWSILYNNILVANYVIENVGKAIGSESSRNQLYGEAYFVRARAYFELVNIYAPNYDEATATTTMGVPLRLDTGVKNTYTRASIKQVYQQIEDDLYNAIRYFEQTTENLSLWHPNKKAAQLLLSRVYLYKGEWDNVISVASELISSCPAGLYDLATHTTVPFVSNSNPEIFHTYGDCFSLIVENDESNTWHNDVPNIYSGQDDNGYSLIAYGISTDLLNSFLEGDCRSIWDPNIDGGRGTYLLTSDGIDLPAKWHSQFTSLGAYNYRLSEAYLNRAEAYAAKGMNIEALNDVRELIEHRVKDISKIEFPTENSEIRKFVLDERRREFFGENHRWFDLKRTTSWYPKQITHKITLRSTGTSGGSGVIQGYETYILAPNDPNFVFELPETETQINSEIELYGKRVEKIAIKDN